MNSILLLRQRLRSYLQRRRAQRSEQAAMEYVTFLQSEIAKVTGITEVSRGQVNTAEHTSSINKHGTDLLTTLGEVKTPLPLPLRFKTRQQGGLLMTLGPTADSSLTPGSEQPRPDLQKCYRCKATGWEDERRLLGCFVCKGYGWLMAVPHKRAELLDTGEPKEGA